MVSTLAREPAAFSLPSIAGAAVVASSCEGAWAEVKRRYDVFRAGTLSARDARRSLGLALIELRKQATRHAWLHELDRHGIHRKTAWRALRDAAEHLGLNDEQRVALVGARLGTAGKPAQDPSLGTPWNRESVSRQGRFTGESGELDTREARPLPRELSCEPILPDEVPEDFPASRESAHRDGRQAVALHAACDAGGVTNSQGVPAAQRSAAPATFTLHHAPRALHPAKRRDVAGQLAMDALYSAAEALRAGLERVLDRVREGVRDGTLPESCVERLHGLMRRVALELNSSFDPAAAGEPAAAASSCAVP